MFTQSGAKFAAVCSARGRYIGCHFRTPAAIAAIAASLAGCMPATTPLAGADPADPSAKVASVGYRSTTAPYTSLRPASPAPWRERNDGVAPQSKPDR